MVTLANPRRIPVKVAHRISAIYDLLSGPATSKQERMRAEIANAERIIAGLPR